MKNSFLLSILILVSIFFFGTEINGYSFIRSSTITMNNSSMKPGPTVSVKFEIGENPGCKLAFWVCEIGVDLGWDVAAPPPGSNTGTMTINSNGKLEVILLSQCISDDYKRNYYSSDYFKLDRAYELSRDICARLGISKYTMKAGRYKIEKLRTGNLKIVF